MQIRESFNKFGCLFPFHMFDWLATHTILLVLAKALSLNFCQPLTIDSCAPQELVGLGLHEKVIGNNVDKKTVATHHKHNLKWMPTIMLQQHTSHSFSRQTSLARQTCPEIDNWKRSPVGSTAFIGFHYDPSLLCCVFPGQTLGEVRLGNLQQTNGARLALSFAVRCAVFARHGVALRASSRNASALVLADKTL